MAYSASDFGFSIAGQLPASPPILAAEFTNGSKTRSAKLTITQIDPALGKRTFVAAYPVKNKRDARKLATSCSATPWNF